MKIQRTSKWMAACTLGLLAVGPGASGAGKKAVLPNILLIMTDDQNLDTVACYGRNPHAVSPSIDRLANEGVLFGQAFANAPQCATSRLSVMTGKYCHHNGMYNFDRSHDDTPFYKPALPTVLFDEKEYWKGLVGKDHIFFLYKNRYENGKRKYDLWDLAFRKARNAPDRDFYIYRKDKNGKTHITSNIAPPPKDDAKYGIIRSYTFGLKPLRRLIDAGYSNRGRGKTMDDFILKDFRTMLDTRINATDGRPNFIDLSFVFPHTPILPPEDVAKKFEKIAFDVPGFSEEERESIRTQDPQMWALIQDLKSYDMKPADKLKILQDYYAFSTYGDELVGKAADDFKAFCEKQQRPWMIIFTADQGWHLHEHGMLGKFTMYDESVRVPLIIASSDKKTFPPGTRYDGLVELVDLAPTILQFAGINPQKYKDNFDGVPLQDMMSGKHPPKDHILCETGHVFGHWALYRTKKWAFSMKTRPKDLVYGKDMGWAKRQPPEKLDMMLFNLKNDPEQKHNLAYHPEYKQIRDDFRRKLQAEVLGPDRVEYDWNQHPLDKKKWWGK